MKPTLKNLKSLLGDSITLYNKRPPCVYFLISNNEVIYIGRTVNLSGRLIQHRNWFNFDAVYLLYEFDYQAKREWELIETFQPKYNVHGTGKYYKRRYNKD